MKEITTTTTAAVAMRNALKLRDIAIQKAEDLVRESQQYRQAAKDYETEATAAAEQSVKDAGVKFKGWTWKPKDGSCTVLVRTGRE